MLFGRKSKQGSRKTLSRAICEALETRRLLATYYVSPFGSDSASGLSPAEPLRNIQAAVNKAKVLATQGSNPVNDNTILVAEGTYTYQASLAGDSVSLGRASVVGVFDHRVSIIGGYNTSFTAVTGRSVIDGENTVRGVSVIASVYDTGITIENFVIQNGFGGPSTIDTTLTAFGGGMMIDMGADQTSNPTNTLRNIIFQNNTVQGADSGSVGENSGAGGEACGGGLAALFANDILMQDVVFDSNSAIGGTGPTRGGAALGAGFYGGIGSTFRGQNITFTDNRSIGGNSTGSGKTGLITADGFGGGFALLTNCSVSFFNVVATGNIVQGGNAGSGTNNQAGSGYGGAFYAEESDVQLVDAIISGNSAIGGNAYNGGTPAGGGIFSFQSALKAGTLTLSRVRITDNTVTAGIGSGNAGGALGGGIAVQRYGSGTLSVSINDSLIAQNTVNSNGPGGAAAGNSGGGGIWSDGATVTMNHVTLADNSVQSNMEGAAVHLYSGTASLANSIVANHADSNRPALNENAGEIIFSGKVLLSGNADDGAYSNPGNAIFGNAGFVDADGGNYDLTSTSDARDASSGSASATDVSLSARDDTPDLGAFEYGSPTPPSGSFDKLAAYRPTDGSWSLDSNGNRVYDGGADLVHTLFSPPGRTGVAGDWNNAGEDRVGDFFNGEWRFDLNGDGVLTTDDRSVFFGRAGDTPIVGNFYGTGTRIGVFRTADDGYSGLFIIDTDGDGFMDDTDERFIFGIGTDRIVIGDWTGDGIDKVGVFRSTGDAAGSAIFSLDANNDHNFVGGDQVFVFGYFTDGIVIGKWDGTGADKVGVYRAATAYGAPFTAVFTLDNNASLAYEGGTDEVFLYGLITDQFVAGNWIP